MPINNYLYDPGAVNLVQCIGGTIKFDSESEADAADGIAVIGSLPKNVEVLAVVSNVKTAFNAADTNVLEVGTVAGVDDLAADNDLAPTAGGDGKFCGKVYTAATVVKAKYSQTGTAATAGEADITVMFIKLPD